MNERLTVTEAAEVLTEQAGCSISPRMISDLLYRRILDTARCPIIGDRRMIPPDYLPELLSVLRERGFVSTQPEGGQS
jgi:hypothetical protein